MTILLFRIKIFRDIRKKKKRLWSYSQPIPSLSPSNLCGSGCNTVNLFWGISPQSKSGGGGGIQKSGYEGSQSLCIWVDSGGGGWYDSMKVWREKRTN